MHRGFTTNGGNGTVSVFDTNTLKTIKKISVAKDPDFIFYDVHTNRVFVCHGDAAAITTIDPEKETVVGKIDLGGGAEAAVVNGQGAGFVNLEEEAEVVSFDPQGLVVKQKCRSRAARHPPDLPLTRPTPGCSSVAGAKCSP